MILLYLLLLLLLLLSLWESQAMRRRRRKDRRLERYVLLLLRTCWSRSSSCRSLGLSSLRHGLPTYREWPRGRLHLASQWINIHWRKVERRLRKKVACWRNCNRKSPKTWEAKQCERARQPICDVVNAVGILIERTLSNIARQWILGQEPILKLSDRRKRQFLSTLLFETWGDTGFL